MIKPGDLYREIDDVREFRGEGYYTAEWALGTVWNDAIYSDTGEKAWRFACYSGDEFILRKLPNDEYLIVGVRPYRRKGDMRWGIPHNTPGVEYRVRRSQIKNLEPRL